MSQTLTYTLEIRYPDEIDSDTWDEIIEASESHDDTDAKKVARWIGGALEAGEDVIGDGLPDRWRVKISGPIES